jgi:formiminotetrahydrofolate cyclodeaminase
VLENVKINVDSIQDAAYKARLEKRLRKAGE